MRLKAAIYTMLLGVVLAISGCSSTNEAYDKAVENGITAIEKEEYDSAVQFFEEAVGENKEDKQAASYLSQAQLLVDIEGTIESKNYEDAITYIEKIHEMDEPLDIVKEKAGKLERKIDNIKQDQAYQKEIEDIRSLIEEGEYDQAETKLSTIKNLLEGNSYFDKQLQELSLSLEEGRNKAEAEAESAKEKEEEEKKKQEEDYDHKQSNQYTYNRYTNGRFGFSVKIPSSFTAGPEPTNGDGRVFTDGDCTITASAGHMNIIQENETIETYYEWALKDIVDLEEAYHTVSGNSYVVSYVEGDKIIYHKGIAENDCITTLIIEYPASLSAEYDSMVNEVAKSLTGGHSD